MMCDLRRRDSFDRFGDDLSQLILRYLSISDCFGLQCVSKQFKHLIFTKQTRLAIGDGFITLKYGHSGEYDNSRIKELLNDYFVSGTQLLKREHTSKDLLNYVMNKCANINHIILNDNRSQITDEQINIISNKCKHIKRLVVIQVPEVSLNCWQQFARKSLQNLVSLELGYNVGLDIIATLIQLCPKLKSIHSMHNIDSVFDRCLKANTVFATNVINVGAYRVKDERFQIFADHFKNQLKSLNVWFVVASELPSINDYELEIAKHLVKFENLECLRCRFSPKFQNKCIELLFKQIGSKCLRLKVLEIESDSQYYALFNSGFQSLEKLIIRSFTNSNNFSFLKNCVNLFHLKLHMFEYDCNDFIDIHLYLPQVKSFDLRMEDFKSKQDFINIMKYLEKLPNLCVLKIGYTDLDCDKNYDFNRITTDTVISFIVNCLSVRRIGIYPEDAYIDENEIQEYCERNDRKIIAVTLDDYNW